MRRCRYCGCSELNACIDDSGTTCSWVTEDICSFCVELDAVADFILFTRFKHECAKYIGDYAPEEHLLAARLYSEACA